MRDLFAHANVDNGLNDQPQICSVSWAIECRRVSVAQLLSLRTYQIYVPYICVYIYPDIQTYTCPHKTHMSLCIAVTTETSQEGE